MNINKTKIIIGSAVALAAVATTSAFAFNMSGGFQTKADIFTNPTVIKALTDSGITVPTAAEATAFMTKQKAAHEAEVKLSDADKAGLKTLKESFKKQERDYLRSKGIDLATEADIARFAKIRETLKLQMKDIRGANHEMKGFGKKHGIQNRGRDNDQETNDDTLSTGASISGSISTGTTIK